MIAQLRIFLPLAPRPTGIFSALFFCTLAFCVAKDTSAAQPAKEILPGDTKVYVSVPDLAKLEAKWLTTQLGKLVNDPLMQPFMKDFAKELDATNAGINQRLRVSFSELRSIASGEVCFAIMQTDDVPQDYAYVLSVDTTGRSDQQKALIGKINRDLIGKKAKMRVANVQGVPLVSYDIPPKNAGGKRRELHLFARDSQLVFTDKESAAAKLIDKLATGGEDTLASDPSFVDSIKKCVAAGPEIPQLTWYIEPFGFAYAMRHANDGKAPSPDLAKILQAEGFSAIKGVAGQFAFSSLGNDLVYRAYINAPAVTTKPEKYLRSARILNFPNSRNLVPPKWAPLNSASCLTYNWKMKESFEYVGTLIDAIAQLNGFFKQFLKDLMINAEGITLDVRKDFVAHFGERVVFLTDNLQPLDGEAEELLLCIELTDAGAVSRALNNVLIRDNTAELKEFRGQRYWVIDPNGESDADGPDGIFEDFDNREKIEQPVKRSRGLGSCVMVLKTDNNTGYLCFGIHEKQLVDVVKQQQSDNQLSQQANYQAVDAALKQLCPPNNSFRSFVETNRAYLLNYELFRTDKFHDANTVLAKMLLQAFPVDKGKVLANGRKIPPKNPNAKPLFNLKGANLPPFQKVQNYFKPAGFAMETLDDGWLIHGVLLP
ncbi:MAG: hypothetical protein ACI9HK_003269 [Pirellulaceae bacterium]